MTFSSFVDLCIGLMLLYLLLSLVCTTINELLQNWLSWRAEGLEKTLKELIDNDAVRATFNEHGLIAAVKAAARGHDRDAKPAYIPSLTVATALLDSVAKVQQANTTAAPAAARIFAFADFKQAALDLPPGKIRDVLLTSLSSANDDLAALKTEIARNFDNAMDRLSGSYKRSMQQLSFVVGMAIAVALNADSILVAKAIWHDQNLRSNLVQVATDTVKASDSKTPESKTCALPADAPTPPTAAQLAEQNRCLTGEIKTQLEALRAFPIGWPDASYAEAARPDGNVVLWFVLKFFGLVWTGAALALGAPFWFDMLQKFVSIRGTGPRPTSLSDAARK